MMNYSVYEGYMDALRKKIQTIQKKCAKYGCEFHYAEVGEEFKDVMNPDTKQTASYRYVIIEVEGTAVINGWEFVASVESTEKGNIFSKALTDVEIPERYRYCEPTCEHCNTNRARKYTFIVRNIETGEFKMVGKSCLKDYTHGMSAEMATFNASLHEIFEEMQNAPINWGGINRRYYSTEEMLRYAAETVRHFGYTKAAEANSTVSQVVEFHGIDHYGTWVNEEITNIIRSKMESVKFDAESSEAKKMVAEAMDWIKEQPSSNDYMHNLKTVTALNYIDYSKLGILVSLFPTVNRALERQAEKERQTKAEQGSEWQGEVGKKVTFDVESCKIISSWENNFGYYGGLTYLYKIVDKNGNVYTWKTGSGFDDDDAVKKVIGTVKEHSEYRGIKQTVLTRCKAA